MRKTPLQKAHDALLDFALGIINQLPEDAKAPGRAVWKPMDGFPITFAQIRRLRATAAAYVTGTAPEPAQAFLVLEGKLGVHSEDSGHALVAEFADESPSALLEGKPFGDADNGPHARIISWSEDPNNAKIHGPIAGLNGRRVRIFVEPLEGP